MEARGGGHGSWKKELQQAVFFGQDAGMEQILARPEVKTSIGSTDWNWTTNESPLHYAALCERRGAVVRLVDAGADVNALAAFPGGQWEAPIHSAVQAGKAEMVKLLLSLGADAGAANGAGESAVDCARRLGLVQLESLLEDHIRRNDATPRARAHSRQASRARLSASTELQEGTFLSQRMKSRLDKEKELRSALKVHEEMESCGEKIRQEQDRLDRALAELKKREADRLRESERAAKELERKLKELRRKERDFSESVRKGAERERRRAEEQQQRLRDRIRELKMSPAFRTQVQIGALTEEVEELNSIAASLNAVDRTSPEISVDSCDEAVAAAGGAAATAAATEEDNRHSCPVCYDHPDSVFSCVECDNWVCGRCKGQLAKCPVCREDFFRSPPRRNRAVERILEKM